MIFKHIFFLVILVLAITSCTKTKPTLDLSGTQFRHNQTLMREELSRLDATQTAVSQISKAHYNFVRGELAMHAGSFQEAINYYELAAAFEKGSAPTLRKRLAQIFVREGRLEEAINEVDRALRARSDDLDLLRLRAGVLAALKRTEEAIQAYSELMSLVPDNQDYYILLASLYVQNEETEEAKKVLTELVKINPNSVFGFYYLARVMEIKGELAEATKFYQKAVELDPNSEGLLIDYARVLAAQGRTQEAIEACQNLIANNPHSIAARRFLGQLLVREKNLDQAIREFEALGELEEDPTDTRLKIGLIKLETQDFQGAELDLSLILANDPENSVARYYLGSTYASMGQIKEAIFELKKIKHEQKMYLEAKSLLAYLLHQEMRYEEAEQAVREALLIRENDVTLLSFLSSVQRDMGKFPDAISSIKKVIEIEPNFDRHYFTLGVYLDQNREKEEALEAVKNAINLNPENAHALNYLGYSYAEAGVNLEEALSLIERAIAIDKTNGYYIDSLGWVYYQMGRYAEALEQLNRAISFVPNDAVILEHLGQVQLKLNKKKEALETFMHGLKFVNEAEDEEVESRLRRRIKEVESDLGISAGKDAGNAN
jgi:tetratricopeptide (TPR) repeat protein